MAYKIIEAEPHQMVSIMRFLHGRRDFEKVEFERLWDSMALPHSLFAFSLVTVFLAFLSLL